VDSGSLINILHRCDRDCSCILSPLHSPGASTVAGRSLRSPIAPVRAVPGVSVA